MKNIGLLALMALVMLQSCENKERLNQIKRQLVESHTAVEFRGDQNKSGKYNFKEVVHSTAPGKFDKDAKPGWVSLSAPKINKPAPPESLYDYSGYYDNYYNDYNNYDYYQDSYDYSYPESDFYDDY